MSLDAAACLIGLASVPDPRVHLRHDGQINDDVMVT
jgi:hypothetical protein